MVSLLGTQVPSNPILNCQVLCRRDLVGSEESACPPRVAMLIIPLALLTRVLAGPQRGDLADCFEIVKGGKWRGGSGTDGCGGIVRVDSARCCAAVRGRGVSTWRITDGGRQGC